MSRIRLATIGAAATALIVGVSMASASSSLSTTTARSTAMTRAQIVTQLHALEQRAAAVGNTTALAALQQAERGLQARTSRQDGGNGRPTNPPPPCPTHAPNAGGLQPCGHGPGFPVPPPCPSAAPNAGGLPPCGHPSPSASPTPSPSGSATPAACGPADQGGTAANGIISGPLYGVGLGISNANAQLAPLGDAVQTIACAIYTNLSPL